MKRTALVHAPTGKDSVLIDRVLAAAGIGVLICKTAEDLCRRLSEHPGAVLLAEEALTRSSIEALSAAIALQPTWSDLPIIVLTTAGEATGITEQKRSILKPLGNLTLVERPVRPVILVSVVRSALRARERQYEVRDLLERLAAQTRTLERSNEDLRQFAYAASHDLQEPLRGIVAHTQLLSRRLTSDVDAETREQFGFVVDAGKRMQELIYGLLAYSRALHDPDEPLCPVDSSLVYCKAVSNLATAISETRAVVEATELPPVLVHEVHLLQMMQNLIGNAIKYRREGVPPHVVVSGHTEGGRAILSVSDNGVGIRPEHQQAVFGIFKRLHARDRSGAGIGLAVCYKIAERYGGSIRVTSVPGEGSTFTFDLPLAS